MEKILKNQDYLPLFWVNKEVWCNKYINTISEALKYSFVCLLVDTPLDKIPAKVFITSISELHKNKNLIDNLLNGKREID